MHKKSRIFFAAVFAFVLVFSFARLNTAEKREKKEPRYGGVLRVKAFSNVFMPELDPASSSSYIFVSEQLFDGLVRLGKNLGVNPGLAEYWKISPDGKRYTFYLRKGVKFHHGKELTAEDVKFSLERLISKEVNSPHYPIFTERVAGAKKYREGKARDVTGFKVQDKYIFEIQLMRPYVSTLYLLSMNFCKILPRDLVILKGKGFFSKPSGTGPFKFSYWLRNTRLKIIGVRLERNDNYFGQRPYLKAVEFSPYFTLDHFLNKEIEIIPLLSEKLFNTDCQILEGGTFNLMFLGMSCHIPPLDRKTIRRALLHGINKSEIVLESYTIESMPNLTNRYIPAKLPGFFPTDVNQNYDPVKAKELLLREGFSTEKKFPLLTLFFDLPKTEIKYKVYRELKRQLDDLGIRLRVKYYRSLAEVRSFNSPYLIFYDRFMSFPDPEDIIRPLFSSKSYYNVFGYVSPRLDKFLEEADSERSWTARIELFRKMEQILFEDIPAIPLFSNHQRIAVRPCVKGVEVPPLGFYHLEARKIWLDK